MEGGVNPFLCCNEVEKVNKTELKNFAIQSRRQLIDQVKIKALMYGIDEQNDLEIQEQFGQLMINDKPYPLYMKPAFNSLKNQLKQKGYKQLVEEVAYTWFNRIIAIRYMEVHDYLPEKVNVLSSSVGRVDPDILFEYETMDLPVKQEEIRELLHAGDTEGAYRKLFIAQCNTLNSILPFLFEQIQDYTELLLPDFLLDAESVIKVLVQNDELTNSFEEIEVIGWLYQYYIAEEKDRVFAQKSKYKKEEIPFATQLFTPKWIVQYMVQNSLGRYWTEAHQEDEDLISNWEYFIKHEEEDFHEKIAPYVNKELKVEDIKLLDPAMGSGHILVYAFEVFHQIYEKCGYPERDIPRLILENNLYGLDIDDRAYQLAAFAVVMKAASYSRRFLRSVEREGIQLNLASIQETNHISDDVIAYIAQEEVGERFNQVRAFFDQYYNGKTYGSLVEITERDIKFIEERLENIEHNPVENLFYSVQHDIAKEVLPALIQQTKIMSNDYDIVVMNPPYMGKKGINDDLSKYLSLKFPNSKSDLFAVFIEKSKEFLNKNGLCSLITMESWMFLGSFESFRIEFIENVTISDFIHMPYDGKGKTSLGINFGTSCFVYRNYVIKNLKSKYQCIHYNEIDDNGIPLEFPTKNNRYKEVSQESFNYIKGRPISYWASEKIRNIFKENQSIAEVAEPRQGMATSDNNTFLRFWYEVNMSKIGFGMSSNDEAHLSKKKWFPYNKGGDYRKWYGNQEYVVNWENNGEELKAFKKSVIRNPSYYFKEGITWTLLSSSKFGVRYIPKGFIFDTNGMTMFVEEENLLYLLGIMSSKYAIEVLKVLNPTLAFQIGDIKRIPIKFSDEKLKLDLEKIVKENIELAKYDWDKSETSWDYQRDPLYLKNVDTLEVAFSIFSNDCNLTFQKMYKNEIRMNEMISDIYSLEDEFDNQIQEEAIVLEKPSKLKQSVNFLSYFIGCTMGRYSIDKDGLSFAGGELDEQLYNSYKPNKFGIIHFTESQYFEDDIILRLREFLSITFSPDTVDENMHWLADSLQMKDGEDAEGRLRSYFLDEFYTDHCKMYQRHPIYWLVDSGKQKGLRTLIYMHRYQPDIMATIRFEHLQEIQAKYQNEINDLENRLVNPNLSASEKKKLTAEKTSFEKKMDELREFDKRLAEIANEEIEIDLDDGVKVNYEKFYRGGKGVLAKIK